MIGVLALTEVSTPAYSCATGTASGTRRDVTTWKERLDEAERQQEAAQLAYQKASEDRARALQDGVAELGSQAAVARDLGVKRASVNQAIKALERKQNPS